MKISELEAKLKELREEHGDLPVGKSTKTGGWMEYEKKDFQFIAKDQYEMWGNPDCIFIMW